MARTHARSPSPAKEQEDSPTVKKLKSVHVSEGDPTNCFANELLTPHNIHRLNQEYANSEPYKYCRVDKLFQDSLLESVKDECLSELRFTTKETDIYRVCAVVCFLSKH